MATPTAHTEQKETANHATQVLLGENNPFAEVMQQEHAKDVVARAVFGNPQLETKDFKKAKYLVSNALIDRIDFSALESLSMEGKRERVRTMINSQIQQEVRIPLTKPQQDLLAEKALDDVLGFGPLEPLLSNSDISDIMINGANKVYVEKKGKIYVTDVNFDSEKHLLNIVQKIVGLVGRRVDESSPMVDARMPDGSRFNAIIPPLSLEGSLVSIRKFKRHKMPLSDYVGLGSMTREMCDFLEICGNIRLNIIVSGGTGSGKTTMLNALSGHIDAGERVITIEDAAELQLHQPHVLRLETRPPNMEGSGEISQRQLLRNALRMRPDRIILGEIRGDEVIDVLAAMNTGHEGSMATIHANTPKDCLSRIENLIGLSGANLSLTSMRAQIASAVHLIVQVARMRDGKRRVVQIEEVVGLAENNQFITQTLFSYKTEKMQEDGKLTGQYVCHGHMPEFIEQADYFGQGDRMRKCIDMAKNSSEEQSTEGQH